MDDAGLQYPASSIQESVRSDTIMDDATITQEEPLIKERFPSVVDTDDLIFELGKQAVKAINYEKLLDSMLKKTQALSAATSDVTQARSEMEAP